MFKETLKCCFCGYDFDCSALQFHHIIPNDKNGNVYHVISAGDFNESIQELEKCAILCANCHHILHNSPNLTNATNIVNSLIPVDTTTFINLCNKFNVLIDDLDEDSLEDEESEDDISEVSRAIIKRMDFIKILIDKKQSGELLNDTKIRQHHKDFYGKGIGGVISKMILNYINDL